MVTQIKKHLAQDKVLLMVVFITTSKDKRNLFWAV